MISILKGIPLIEDISISNEDGALVMMIDGHQSRGYLCNLSMVLAIAINGSHELSIETVRYLALLIGGYPDIHDYSLRLTAEGGWFCCLYDKHTTSEEMAKEIEKQLALTRYLQSLIAYRQQLPLDRKYEII